MGSKIRITMIEPEVGSSVEVEDVESPLSEANFDRFQCLFNPLLVCDDYGIDLYCRAREFMSALV